jgi:hypothetical protein
MVHGEYKRSGGVCLLPIGIRHSAEDEMIYLASPYSADPIALHAQVLSATAELVTDGHAIFSPIVHCHPLAQARKLPHDFAFWQRYNFEVLERARELWVLMLPGWRDSIGVRGEIAFARKRRIPIFQLEPGTLRKMPLLGEWSTGSEVA